MYEEKHKFKKVGAHASLQTMFGFLLM
jgi:hypothetical protein